MRLQLDRKFYTPKDSEIISQTSKAIVYGFTNNLGKICAVAFYGKAQKPSWRFAFRSNEARSNYIEDWLIKLEGREQYKVDRKQKEAEEIKQADIKPGDYFSTSWGYDQTNIDFLVVVSVTEKTAICKMVDKIDVGASGQSDVIMPGTGFGRLFRMKISGKDSLRGSYPYCCDQSSMRFGYFSKTSIGQVHYETNSLFGH